MEEKQALLGEEEEEDGKPGGHPWLSLLTILLSSIPISHHLSPLEDHPEFFVFSFSCCSAPAQAPASSTHETLLVGNQNHLMGFVPLQ